MSTRGAHSCVRMTPTGRPDWTIMVSSPASVVRVRERIEAGPVAGGATGAAVDDEFLGVLGDLGVQVVLQHPQRRFLGPPSGGHRGWCANRSWPSGGHQRLLHLRGRLSCAP